MVKAANTPRLLAAWGAWSRMDVVRAAPTDSARVAWSQAPNPPGCWATIGTNQTATPAAPAATVARARCQVRVETTTGTSTRRANASTIDWRNPASSPSAANAATPCQLPGRARQARMIRRQHARRSNEYVATMEPVNHTNGEVATSTPVAVPIHQPPRSRPATTASPAPTAEATAATRTRLVMVPRPPTADTRRPAST